jgi:glutathione synthase/RimK-type ligase-like ATP-grasp enzyme
MKIAFATSREFADGHHDDLESARLAGADFRVWNDATVDWQRYDRVVIRSTWDYTIQLDAYLGWCRAVGPERLRNRPDLVQFSSDKRYLDQLRAPTVPTTFLAEGDPLPELSGEVVVKPTVSAGARDAGRFSPARYDEATALIDAIRDSGRTAMIQPYLARVDELGETTIVYIGGEPSHAVRKQPLLRADAPTKRTANPAAPQRPVITATEPTEAERRLADAVHTEIAERFSAPLYARIDLIPDQHGEPVVSELELIEPHLYLAHSPPAARRLADAVHAS